MHLLRPLAVAAALAFTAFAASAVTTYDAAADFSTTNNGTGGNVWSYGTTNGFVSTPFTIFPNNTPIGTGYQSWSLNGTPGNVPADWKTASGVLAFHPGTGDVTAVYRFTAPSTGLYDVVTSFYALDPQATTQVAVLVDGVQQGSLININSTTPGGLYLSALSLINGQTIDVEVGNGGNGLSNDSTGLTFRVTAVPEPETAALMLAGLAAVGFVAKRRKS